ncbi:MULTISPECIES: MarR family transcriptional regulator [unclassified Clostridium]|uniref:MarR family winged helix-turn-helix transcriptional regulator n=1 Tax=unclassified Clostridium TaxID=2614128 RepID=UPI0002985BC4|nr:MULTISPECIES: MarR family transcriptional regulator [unclassified Clostridium]EKQ51626.1 MAG: transcriptional regulator [Clostridium sp. Maddingley MBC34-26]
MNQQEQSSSPNNELIQKQADEIIEIFRCIRKSISCKYERVAKESGFTAPQLGVIFHLYMMPSITLNELSDHMSLTKSTVSGIVDRLAKQGVVVREIPEDNRRIVKLSISEEFKKNNDIHAIKKKFIGEFISDSIKNMDAEEVEKMIYGLRLFSSLLKDKDDD